MAGRVDASSEADRRRQFEPLIEEVRDIAHGLEISMLVPHHLAYFDGHFPGRPILPGFVLVTWAAEQIAARQVAAGRALTVELVKFLKPVSPGSHLTLRLERAASGSVNFAYRDAKDELSALGRMRFAE